MTRNNMFFPQKFKIDNNFKFTIRNEILTSFWCVLTYDSSEN